VIAYLLAAFGILVGLVLAGTGHALHRLRFAEVTVHWAGGSRTRVR
jgi:hypothetical protein